MSTFINRSLFMRASETLFEQPQSADCRNDLVVLDQAQRIERGDRHHLDMGNIAGGEEQLFFVGLNQDQSAAGAELGELRNEKLGARCAHLEVLNCQETVLT